MPAPIIEGFINFLTPFLQDVYPAIEVWDGEIPRYDTLGQPINLDLPMPSFRVAMDERGFTRKWTQADPYGDTGDLSFEGWAKTRADCMKMLNTIEAPLVDASNLDSINLPGGPIDNPYSVYECLFKNWTCIQLEGIRDQNSSLIYYGRATFTVGVHGAIITRSS